LSKTHNEDIEAVLEQVDTVQYQSDEVYSWLVKQRTILEEDIDKVPSLKVFI